MNVNQMFVAKIVDAVLSTIHLFVSVCLNTKELHQVYHVYRQKMLAQFHPVDQTRSARDCQME